MITRETKALQRATNEQCRCACHTTGAGHITGACCTQCPTCRRFVKHGHYDAHKRACDRTRFDGGLTAREVPRYARKDDVE